MINAIFSGFSVLKKPSLLAPGIFLTLVQSVLLWVFFFVNDTLPRFYYELFVLNIFPDTGFLETVFLLVAANLQAFLFIGFLLVLWFGAVLWMVFSFTNVLSKNESGVSSVFSPAKSLGKIFGLSVFFSVLLLLFFAGLMFFIWLFILGGLFELIGIVLILAWIVFWAYLYFKLLFLPVEFFSKNQHITYCIKNVWKWSGKKFFSLVIFIVIISIVSNIILQIGVFLSELVSEEIVSILIILFALVFSSAYFGYSLVNYYFSQN